MAAEFPSDDPFVAHLDLIQRVIGSLCRRKRLSDDEAEELTSWVYEKLLDNDRAILRKFEGKSSLKTYLTTVVHRLYLDWRNSRWGKWRPSAAAKRLGPVAVQLERLTTRDGFSFDEACRVLQDNHGVTETWRELEAMAAELPVRSGRRAEGGEALETLPAPEAQVDQSLLASERAARRRQAEAALGRALAKLPSEDSLIVKMRYLDGFQVAAVARALHLPQKPLYRRVERLLGELRRKLEGEEGLTAAELAEMLRGRRFEA